MSNGRIAIGSIPLPERPIRVSVPARVAFNLQSMQEVTASLLGRLGCPECHSGFDIRFDVIRNFRVDDNLKLHEGGVIIEG